MTTNPSTSLYDELAARIRNNERFQSDLDNLIIREIRTDILKSEGDVPRLSAKQVAALAEAAAALSCSSLDRDKALAYQVAYLLANQYLHEFPGLNGVARLVFSRVGNLPAEQLLPAVSEGVEMPVALGIEAVSKRIFNRLEVGQESYVLTDFQVSVLEKLRTAGSISLSAPTSAGKSFMITQFVVERFRTSLRSPYTAVILVPTRALIRQFQRDCERELARAGIQDVKVATSALAVRGMEPYNSRTLFVLTQERLQYLLSIHEESPLALDLVIVDEAQKLDDESRGIVLESTLLDALRRSPKAQVVFLAPLARNPESLLRKFHLETGEPIVSTLSPVAQNLIDVSVKDHKASMIVLSDNRRITVVEDEPLSPQVDLTKKEGLLSYIAWRFGGDHSNIIYCNSPAEAEGIAKALRQHCELTRSVKIERFCQFLSDHIHKDYWLIDYMRHGIGFHYGDMPEVVRQYVETLFKEREFRFLCCTSTLLEGVNLPAKNIFIYKPKQGRVEIDDSGFWNLAGRAGRFMADFAGNVFCINTHEWKRGLDERERTYELESALEKALVDRELPQFILSGTATSAKRSSFQQALSFLLPTFLEHGRSKVLEHIRRRVGPDKLTAEQVDVLVRSLEAISSDIHVPSKLLRDNNSIDPRRIEALHRHLKVLPRGEVEGLIPVHPATSGFYHQLERMFAVIDRYLANVTGNSYRYFTYIAHAWIKESHLKEIIEKKIERSRQNGKAEDELTLVNTSIRGAIRDVNHSIRYQYVKYMTCYVDVFKHAFPEQVDAGHLDLDLPGYLEMGAYRPSTLEFMNLGLSRMTAILLSDLAQADGISSGFTSWLSTNQVMLISLLPDPCAEDLAGLVISQ